MILDLSKQDMPARYTVIRGGRLLDAVAHAAPETDILLDGDVIAAVGPPGMDAPAEARTVDARRRLMHPGLINAHTHGHGVLSKGMGDRWTLETLLAFGPWLNGSRHLEDKYLATYIGAVEMLMKGCTACYDLTAEVPLPTLEGLDACARAYQDAGVRAVLAPMTADKTFYEAIPGLADALPEDLKAALIPGGERTTSLLLSTARRWITDWRFDRDWVRPALGPTIPHHCTDEYLLGCAALAREFGLGLHTHVQETKVQIMAGLSLYGGTQTAHLDRLGILAGNLTAAHGVWCDDDDMRRFAARGASIVHNPASNMRLGSGIADVSAMKAHGINVALGSDGANSSDNLNMYEAMKLASLSSKVRDRDITRSLRTEEAFQMATTGGAQALGLDQLIGKIAPGFKADIVFLDLDHPNWMPMNDPTNQLVHTEDGTAVHSVMVGGIMRVENGQPVGIDLAALSRRAEDTRDRLEATRRDVRFQCESVASIVHQHCLCLTAQTYKLNRYAGN